jgi:hypothetical protein
LKNIPQAGCLNLLWLFGKVYNFVEHKNKP